MASINTIGTEDKSTDITINWLRRYQLTDVKDEDARNKKGINEVLKHIGIYIIEKKDSDKTPLTYEPIYVGSAITEYSTRKGGGLQKRLVQHFSDCFDKYKINPDEVNLTVKIGLVAPSEQSKNAENIIVRTFIREPSLHKLTNKKKSSETNPIYIKGRIKLELTGFSPEYLIERLDTLSRDTNVVTESSETVKGSSYIYILKTTEETVRYESFANSLTLRELRELEWV